MTEITVTLPDGVAQALDNLAAQCGMTRRDLAAEGLTQFTVRLMRMRAFHRFGRFLKVKAAMYN